MLKIKIHAQTEHEYIFFLLELLNAMYQKKNIVRQVSVENCSKQFTICILGNGEEIERGSFYFMKSMHVYLQIRNT